MRKYRITWLKDYRAGRGCLEGGTQRQEFIAEQSFWAALDWARANAQAGEIVLQVLPLAS